MNLVVSKHSELILSNGGYEFDLEEMSYVEGIISVVAVVIAISAGVLATIVANILQYLS